MTAAHLDTIPVRVRPVPGEALDSWLEAYARRLHAGVPDIFRLAGLAISTDGPASHAIGRKPWMSFLAPDELAALSTVTAVPAADLATMTLARYDGTLVSVDPGTRALRPSRWWPQTGGSRFCPPCLAESGGRWPLAWRLPWVFACLRHHVLLAGACPSCGNRARLRWSARDDVPQPAACRSPAPGPGRQRGTCGHRLAAVQTRALPGDGLVLQAQRKVSTLVSALLSQHDAGAGEEASRHVLGTLDDIFAAGRAAVTASITAVPMPRVSRQALAELGNPVLSPGGGHARYGQRRYDTPMVAFGAAVAVAMLRQGPDRPDPAVIRWLASGSVAWSAKANPGAGTLIALRYWKKATPELQGALLKQLSPRLTLFQRLRYCTSTPTPRRPAGGSGKDRARAVPALLWPGWALRLNPAGLCDSLPYRATLSVLLLQAASRNTYAAARAQLGLTPGVRLSSGHFAARLGKAGALDAVLSALGQLARKLDESGSPIDYARRRALFMPAAFDYNAWRDCCNQIGHPLWAGQERTAAIHLTELLTGSNPRYFPPPHNLGSEQNYSHAKAVILLPAELITHLHGQAQRLLAAAGISEPVQWEPPFGWAEDISWPGPQAGDVPAGTVWQFLRTGHSHQETARRLGTSIEHIRLAAARNPAALPARSPAAPPNSKIPRSALPGKDDIRGYHAAGLGRRAIARLTGCGESTATRLLEEAGLPPRPPGYRTAHVTAEWLTDRYVDRGLTLEEISAEAQLGPACLARLARQFGIPLRRGGAAHRNPLASLGSPADFPPGIWAAFGRSGGEQRIRRTLAIMQQPTFATAARRLHLNSATISNQVASLEKDLGITLITRKAGNPKTTVTAEGRTFARAARNLLRQIDQQRQQPPSCQSTPSHTTALASAASPAAPPRRPPSP